MIQLSAVSKRYGPPRPGAGTLAVRELTLDIPRGGCRAVVGPNGAGKTTLFGLVLGFLRPTAGDVEIEGDDPRRYIRRHGAGYLPERFSVPPEWPVRAALLAFAKLEGLRAAAAARADEALERFGLTGHADRAFGELSHGLKQRVGLAQAFLGERDLIVLDEPTEGLDPLWRIRLREAVGALRARGATVLIASHDLAEVERMADHVIVIDRGAVRQVFQTRADAAPRAFALRLETPSDEVARLFPGAQSLDSAPGALYHVTVDDARDLSGRLAALLATGAVLAAMHPLGEPLEERVRRALDEPDA
jgi:ABC-type multidrug transport system ATPase subunit